MGFYDDMEDAQFFRDTGHNYRDPAGASRARKRSRYNSHAERSLRERFPHAAACVVYDTGGRVCGCGALARRQAARASAPEGIGP